MRNREIKLLPNINGINYQPCEGDLQYLRSLKPEQYAAQLRQLLEALDETNRILRDFGFQTTLKITWGSREKFDDPSEAVINKEVSL